MIGIELVLGDSTRSQTFLSTPEIVATMAAPKRPLEEVDVNVPSPQRLRMSELSDDRCPPISIGQELPGPSDRQGVSGQSVVPETAPVFAHVVSAPAATSIPSVEGQEAGSTGAASVTAQARQYRSIAEKLEHFRKRLSLLPGHVIVVTHFQCLDGVTTWEVLGVNATFDAAFDLVVENAPRDPDCSEASDNESEEESSDGQDGRAQEPLFDQIARKAELVDDKVEINFANNDRYDDNEDIIRIERFKMGP